MLPDEAEKLDQCIKNIETLREWKKSNFSTPLSNLPKSILNYYELHYDSIEEDVEIYTECEKKGLPLPIF